MNVSTPTSLFSQDFTPCIFLWGGYELGSNK